MLIAPHSPKCLEARLSEVVASVAELCYLMCKRSGGECGAKEIYRMSAQTTDNGRQEQHSPLKTERGATTIQDSVVSKVAGIAAQEVEGITMGSATTQTVGN
jgi:hypothetical protein